MIETKRHATTTIRLDAALLREAQYYLSLESCTLTKFMQEQIVAFIQRYRQAHPEVAPADAARLTQVLLRVPPEVLAILEAQAGGQSVNAQAVRVLRMALGLEPPPSAERVTPELVGQREG